jgi:hypothetical protein
MRETQHILLVLGALGVSALSLISSDSRAVTSAIDRRCEIFSSARDRARCTCAVQQGGWVTEVQGEWRWIYPRRHQERHCHGQIGSLSPS